VALIAYSDFRYPDVLATFGLTLDTSPDLFAGVPPVAPGPVLAAALPVGLRLGPSAHTESSRATWMVGPLLSDFWWRYQGRITLISGAEFPADPDAGLSGYVDFVIGKAPQQPRVVAPVVLIFEAKRDSIPDGLGQCIAGLVGAQRFNRRDGIEGQVFGAVTTGSQWKFLRLDGAVVTADLMEYPLAQADKLLGILTHIVGPASEPAAA
jgi:hypothetical protein